MPSSFSSVQIHFVFSTKNRHPFLSDAALRSEMHRFIGGVSRKLDCPPLIVGGVADHVHVLAGLGRSVSQAEWVKEVKRVSSLWIKERQPSLRDFSWQGGYGAFSVDHTSIDRIRTYVGRQEEHHRTVSVQDEFRQLLREHGVEFDEKYIWE